MPNILLRREVIYKQVWERPMRQVAQDYRISDVGLKKACRRLDVPTPPVGYWAKRAAGQKLGIPPLPPPTRDVREAVEVRVSYAGPMVDLLPEPDVVVSDHLRKPQPLVKLTREELKGAPVDDYGRLCPRDPMGLEIRVSPSQLARALRVADALIRGLEEVGFSVDVAIGWNRKFETCAVIDGERVGFSIREPSVQHKQPKGESKWSYDRYTYVPSGCLELKVEEYVSAGTTKTVRDRSSGNRVEGGLGRFIVSLHAVAQVMKIKRQARVEEDRRLAAELRERQRREREAAYQGWLRQELMKEASAHQQARVIREFLNGIGRGPGRTPTAEQKNWIEWAHLEADRMDPLMNGREVSRPLDPPDSWQPDAQPMGGSIGSILSRSSNA